MKSLIIGAVLALAATNANAFMVMTTDLPTGPGAALSFELFSDLPNIKECEGSGGNGLLVNSNIKGRLERYGSGCWLGVDNGNVMMFVKRYDDGKGSSFTVHKSDLQMVTP